ncbi:hypothetical protein BJX96DRAFT_116579 [Aspergillus floccosus]
MSRSGRRASLAWLPLSTPHRPITGLFSRPPRLQLLHLLFPLFLLLLLLFLLFLHRSPWRPPLPASKQPPSHPRTTISCYHRPRLKNPPPVRDSPRVVPIPAVRAVRSSPTHHQLWLRPIISVLKVRRDPSCGPEIRGFHPPSCAPPPSDSPIPSTTSRASPP